MPSLEYMVKQNMIVKDNSYKRIIKIIEKLSTEKAKSSNDEFAKLATELKKCFEAHFISEEVFMKKICFPKIKKHIAKHQDFINEILLYQKKGASNAEQLVLFVSRWLQFHELEEDMNYIFYAVQKIINLKGREDR